MPQRQVHHSGCALRTSVAGKTSGNASLGWGMESRPSVIIQPLYTELYPSHNMSSWWLFLDSGFTILYFKFKEVLLIFPKVTILNLEQKDLRFLSLCDPKPGSGAGRPAKVHSFSAWPWVWVIWVLCLFHSLVLLLVRWNAEDRDDLPLL